MGNCLQCFKSSSTPSSSAEQGPYMSTTVKTPTSIDTRIGHKIERNDFTSQHRPGETDELLSSSPLNIKRNTIETKRSSFKKSIVVLNGNTNTMGDIITTVKEPQQVSDNTLNLLFEEYKDPHEDAILSEGIERLCKDLEYPPDDFAILVLAWRLDASQMCRFTKTEFIQGLHNMTADTIDTIRLRLQETIENLQTTYISGDTEMFKQLYRFTFRFGLEPDQRILSLDMAIILWRLVFTVNKPDLLDHWLFFLDQHPNIRGIPKDTWNMFLNFSEQCDINIYDDTEAWPSLFDDFVDYEKSRLNIFKQTTNENNNHEIHNRSDINNSESSDIL